MSSCGIRRPSRRSCRARTNCRDAARVIAEARLPLIYAGGGVARSDAEDALVRLAEATNIPVVTSTGGKGTIPDSHPLAYGSCFSPRGERQEMNQLFDVMQSADVVIGIGARFSLGNPAGNSSTLVNINVDDSELMRIQSNTIPLHGDARATIEALLPYLEEAGAGDRSSPAEAVSAARSLIAYYDIGLHEPQYPVLEAIQGSIPEDAFIVWDVTQFGYYARTHYKVNHPKTYLDSGYQFNVGYSFPTALGVKVAQPDRPVVCMVGDGGFLFNASELSTAVQHGINVVTVVFRNDSYGNVARDLNELFGGTYGTDLHNPDLVKFAESFGAVGMRADDPMELATLLPAALERDDAGGHRRPVPRHADPARAADCAALRAALDLAAGGADRVLIGPRCADIALHAPPTGLPEADAVAQATVRVAAFAQLVEALEMLAAELDRRALDIIRVVAPACDGDLAHGPYGAELAAREWHRAMVAGSWPTVARARPLGRAPGVRPCGSA